MICKDSVKCIVLDTYKKEKKRKKKELKLLD